MRSTPQVLSGQHCSLTHDLINKLSVIIGECELLEEHVADPEHGDRLHVILRVAHAMTAAIRGHRCPTSDVGDQSHADAALAAHRLGDVYISQTSR